LVGCHYRRHCPGRHDLTQLLLQSCQANVCRVDHLKLILENDLLRRMIEGLLRQRSCIFVQFFRPGKIRTVRLYSRNAHDWTARLSAIATAAQRIKARSFTVYVGEGVVLGSDGLSLFDKLRRREAADAAILTARTCAIAHSSIAMLRWHGYCAIPRLASCSMNTSPRTALSSLHTPAGWAQRASCRRRSMAPIYPARAASGSRYAIPPASRCSGSGARCGIKEPQVVEAMTRRRREITRPISSATGRITWRSRPKRCGASRTVR
jgi:hypothetical protein